MSIFLLHNAILRNFHAKLSRQSQRKNSTRTGAIEEPDTFDLRDYLTSSNDANQQAGIQHKHVEVNVFGVSGAEEHKIFIRTFANAILGFNYQSCYFDLGLSHFPSPPQEKDANKTNSAQVGLFSAFYLYALTFISFRSSGVLKPGEMSIANNAKIMPAIGGQVLYAGMDAAEMAKFYKGEVVYNEEDDRHIATLTVEQLSSLPCHQNSRSQRVVFCVSRKEFDDEVLNTLLRMLNITHTKRTLVGDDLFVRVSIAEMMTTRARIQSWDNSTRGLDASTALDFVRSLRIMTDILGQTTFVTLYQAGEGIYDLFDKVMVLSEGRQVYYGPPSEARAYFEGLGYKSFPRQSTADYLTGCTDINERQFAPGRSAADYAQDNAVALEKYKLTMATDKADQEAFRAAVTADKKKGVSKKSPYTLGFTGQVRALVVRQFQQRLQDRFQLYTSFTLSTALGLVIGGAFFALPTTAAGAFTRGGLIFAALLTTSIAIANTFADMPFSATRVLLFNIAVYFMSNLNRSAGGFFTFHLLNYIAFLTMQGFFRTFGQLCTNFDSAFRLATFFIPNFIEYTGYILPVNKMKRWLFWIYYLNPVGYAWQAIMENEFRRIDLTCDGAYVVPRNVGDVTKYPDTLGVNQVCTLFGATAASTTVSGHEYLFAAFNLDTTDLWRRCFLVIVGMFFFFQITQVIALEFFPQYVTNVGFKIYAKEDAETSNSTTLSVPRKTPVNKNISDRPYGKTFTWEKLNYVVPVPGGTRRLLHDVNGYVKPGTLTALMGASGAGKTTCLDVLAQRKNIGVISGDVLVDGRPLTSDFARGTAYAEQMDVHEGTATVREAMRFSAYLRQPAHVSIEEKNAYVEEIIELLELQDLSEAVVYCLGVEARKRLTIGVELASKPELLLFLDEPTSGLDAQSAWNLVRFLRKLADQGQAILCTIHQPSSLLFESFDRLLLLETGGETVYFGDIGSDSHVIRDYFARHGAACPPNVNPAEYMLEAIGAGVAPELASREIDTIKAQGLAKPEPNQQTMSTYATSFFYQLKLVVARNNTALWRSPDYIFTRLFVCMFISLWISLSFLQLGNSLRDLQFRVFSIFWVVVLPAIVCPRLNRCSRIYSPYAFAVGQLLGEIPYNVLCGIVYWVLMVYPMHFGQGSAGLDGTGFQLWVIIVMMLFGVSLGQLIAAISPSVQVAVLFNPFIGLVLTTFCGVTIPFPTMNSFWRSWLYQLSPYTRTLAAMVSTELHGLVIKCQSDEFNVFNPPTNQTCYQWANDFVTAAGGYLNNPNATSSCEYCEYAVGDEFYTPLNISYDNRWRDVFIVFAFFVFNVIVTIIASRYLRYAKR
ncbi:hypothetical protein BDP27DRAFT_1383972 [Rhodocollybia butyracea]|uniref:ABC transporter domain-containing protein n=1 Tax=Rhodocollybia butyracea TaxID=206335 RepID=A0A9P5PQF8_9AGAR|nr:hypothetical protein BDP27DRAFT_1383972 [Rhodocollybia butyracea]